MRGPVDPLRRLVIEEQRALRRLLKVGQWHELDVVCRRRNGSIAWAEYRVPNQLFNAGEAMFLRNNYRGESTLPATYYGRLYNDTPVATDALSDLTGEPSGNGYAALEWDRDTTDWGAVELLGSGESRTVGALKSFGPASGGNIGPVTSFVLATTANNSGNGVWWVTFAAPRTIEPGMELDVRPISLMRGTLS